MSNNETAPSIAEQIDDDNGLKSKRKMLMIVSLITLALTFADAKIEEVNTIIFKLSFGNNGGITILLVCSIVFLMIRYFNYARPYHVKIYELWSTRMLEDPFFVLFQIEDDEYSGLIVRNTPKGVNYTHYKTDPDCGLECTYAHSFPLKRRFVYETNIKSDYLTRDTSIGWKDYPKVLLLELRYQVGSYFIDRENLGIYAPYFIGVVAILSYFFVDELQHFLNVITPLTSR
jgi:hypothetical protein